ncbi:hypothetical protein [Actinoplanes sp. NPDC049265]|uniref:hypothetical protein n=1 Tax=Actinoplanes sp. NPDC049265 TaxID=3363902 RepID=UPI003711AD3D
MSEHGWPDHHDGHDDEGQQHAFDHDGLDTGAEHPLPEPHNDAWPPHDELPDDDHDHDHHHGVTVDDDHDDDSHSPAAEEIVVAGHAEHDTDGEPPVTAEADEMFPPMLEVGPLPEPVDGFPWIDTGSLGMSHAGFVDQAMLDRMPAQDPSELAAYAAEDLPPGADPWAHLAASEDPATAALAEFYRPGDTDA